MNPYIVDSFSKNMRPYNNMPGLNVDLQVKSKSPNKKHAQSAVKLDKSDLAHLAAAKGSLQASIDRNRKKTVEGDAQ